MSSLNSPLSIGHLDVSSPHFFLSSFSLIFAFIHVARSIFNRHILPLLAVSAWKPHDAVWPEDDGADCLGFRRLLVYLLGGAPCDVPNSSLLLAIN
jgi:hypothetical protein